ncbi:MAG: glycosyltransferase [Clostridia bacterium]|nr:glycosyltransferase [Clostridia bacterium]
MLRIQQLNVTPLISGIDEAYFRGGQVLDGKVFANAGERVSFDTYFNSFSYTKYRRYTRVDTVYLSLDIEGEARVLLCTFDGEGEEIIDEKLCTGGTVTLSADLSALPELGILYPVIIPTGEVFIRGGEYSAAVTPSDVNVAIAICTYRREDAVRHNLEILSGYEFSIISRVIVVDNGNTLTPSDTESDFIKLYPNKNYGGSAGFTRGIMEAYRASFTHVILMDDDVIIYPEALERMSVFTSILKDEYKNAHLSAAMLSSTKPYYQHEMGARWDGQRIKSFKNALDIRERATLIENMRDEPLEYGAWWCFCLPLSDVDEFGLPLPLFIKFDDVEYGTRCTKNAPIVTLNGVAVSHEDFDRKYGIYLEYYNVRNQLITLSLRKRYTALGCTFRLAKATAKNLFLYRYSAMEPIFRAFGDFLLGADYLMSTDAEELNRSLIASNPKALSLSDVPGWEAGMKESFTPHGASIFKKAAIILTLGGHLIPSFMCKRRVAAFPLPDAKFGYSFGHLRTIQYQLGSDTGYEFNRSVKSFFKCLGACISLSFKILFKFGKAKRSFKTAEARLTSFEFWDEFLSLK